MKPMKMAVRRVVAVCALMVLAVYSVSDVRAGGPEIKLEAALAGGAAAGDVSGKAKFENRLQEGRRKFSVQAEGLGAGQIFDVMVAGTVVGTVQATAAGIADINFDDNFEAGDDPATQFPANFPALDGGELIQLGPVSGSLQPR